MERRMPVGIESNYRGDLTEGTKKSDRFMESSSYNVLLYIYQRIVFQDIVHGSLLPHALRI